jgi:hypothetical protein
VAWTLRQIARIVRHKLEYSASSMASAFGPRNVVLVKITLQDRTSARVGLRGRLRRLHIMAEPEQHLELFQFLPDAEEHWGLV